MNSPQFQQSWNNISDDDQNSAANEELIDFFTQRFKSSTYSQNVDTPTKFKKYIANISSAKVLAILVIGILLIWIAYIKSQKPQIVQPIQVEDQIQKSIESSESQITIEESNQDDQEDESFQFDFVQTQYEGKETEEVIAKKTISEMQQKFNVHHLFPTQSQIEQKQTTQLLENISTLEVMIPDHKVVGYRAQNFYFFSVSIHEMILNSKLDKLYRNGQTVFKISLKQHMRAIIRTQLVHSVSFKGQIEPELSPFDNGLEQKKIAIKQIMDDEETYYEQFYELSKYIKRQLRFCIVVPSYKNVKSNLYLRNLDSIFMQDYDNYHVVYIDDASPDQTGEYVKQYIKQKQIPQQKIKVIINDVNKKALYNIHHGIHTYCPDGEIVGLIDGDDSLLGRKVFQLYNAVYQAKRTALIYSNFLKLLTNNKTSFGFGKEVTPEKFEAGSLRNSFDLVGTHFMTFFSDVFKRIKIEDLSYDNGTLYDYAYDRAIITPMIEMVFPRVEYLGEVTYEYRNDTGINDGTNDWMMVSELIMEKEAYKKLQNFSFIDDFVDETQKILKQEEQLTNKVFEEDGKTSLRSETTLSEIENQNIKVDEQKLTNSQVPLEPLEPLELLQQK